MSNFNAYREAMRKHFAQLIIQNPQLYITDVDKELLWETYLNSYPEEERQQHNCNACKSFIRHYGGVVGIIDGTVHSIWEFLADEPFQEVNIQLAGIVSDCQIVDYFVTDEKNMGRDHDHERQENGIVVEWEHFHLTAPSIVSRDNVDTIKAQMRDSRNVFKRSLNEITTSSVETVLELIAQGSLYRGEESKVVLAQFRALQHRYTQILPEHKDNFCWANAQGQGQAISRIRNTAVGTLLVNISEGMELDHAVRAFEAIMAPANYKRPTAVITQKMIEEAEKTITELGYERSLGRRFATVEDVTIKDLLFVDRNLIKSGGVLAAVLGHTDIVNPKSFTKLEEIPVAKFLSDIVPKISGVEVLLENRHLSNLVSVIAPVHPDAPSMFKWPNGFSWSYKDAVADSMKERVKAAGGKVDGELRISLEWYNFDDLDLVVAEPNGDLIYYANKLSHSGGELDVDMNAGSGSSREAVENVIWPYQNTRMKEGQYTVYVNQYQRRETIDVGFKVEIECQGETLTFGYDKMVTEKIEVAQFNYSKSKGLTLVRSIGGESKTTSKTAWDIETNRFHRVSMVMHSPNHWSDFKTGNAHLFFVIDKAHNNEFVRGFFNEFLKPELETHKHVFEALGSRMRVEPANKQLSGLGFSSTQHNDLIVKLEGQFSRTLRIKF